MARGVNEFIGIGYAGRDAKIVSTRRGTRFAAFSMAISDAWKDKKTGEQQIRTEWVRVVIWDENLVRLAELAIKRGTRLYVRGRLESRVWTPPEDGVERVIVEVVLRPLSGQIALLDRTEVDGTTHYTPAMIAELENPDPDSLDDLPL